MTGFKLLFEFSHIDDFRSTVGPLDHVDLQVHVPDFVRIKFDEGIDVEVCSDESPTLTKIGVSVKPVSFFQSAYCIIAFLFADIQPVIAIPAFKLFPFKNSRSPKAPGF